MPVIINGSTGIQLPDGSASVPAIRGTTSANTGVYFPSANTVGVSSAGTQRFSIDDSGRLVAAYQPVCLAYKVLADSFAMITTAGIIKLESGTKTFGTRPTSAYNVSTGLFTAPVAGLYFFNFYISLIQNPSFGDISFYVNGSTYGEVATVGDYGSSIWRSLGISSFIYLNANDTCGPARAFDGGTDPTNTSWRAQFSGALIS